MNEGDRKKLMDQRIISGAEVTWREFWAKYDELKSFSSALMALKIYLNTESLQLYESILDNARSDKENTKTLIMQLVDKLKKDEPNAIHGQTTHETLAATSQPDKSVQSTLSSQQNDVDAFAETAENHGDLANFGFELEGYRNSDYVKSEAAKLKHDPTIRGGDVRDPIEEVLDDLRNELTDKWYGAQSALRDKLPEKNADKNYRNIIHYAKALNNVLKACAEKTGDPEWTPDPNLIVPLQWMLNQRPADAALKKLYGEVLVNMLLASPIANVDKANLKEFNKAFGKALASNNVTAAYEIVNIMIDSLLKNNPDVTVITLRNFLANERKALASLQPPKATWTEAELMAEVDARIAEEENQSAEVGKRIELNTSILPDNFELTWEVYWTAYDKALLDMPVDDRSARERAFKAHEKVGVMLGVDIKDLEDNQRTVFMKNENTSENYKHDFMAMVVEQKLARSEKDAEAERVLKNQAKLKNLNAELFDMNSKNFSAFISDRTVSGILAIVQKYAGNDRMVKEFGNRYVEVMNLFKNIEKLDEVDPIKRAEQIADLLLANNGKNYQAIVAYTTFFAAVEEKIFAAEPNPKGKPEITARNQEKQLLKNAVIQPFQWLLKYNLHLPLIKPFIPIGSPLELVINAALEKFLQIGKEANLYKEQLDVMVKQMQQLSQVEQSSTISKETQQEIRERAALINSLMPGLKPLEEKMAASSDTESSTSSPRVTDDEDTASDDEIDDYEDPDPVIIQAPGDLDVDPVAFRSRKEFERVTGKRKDEEDIELEAVSKKESHLLVGEYQQIREAFATGKIKEAAKLLVELCKVSMQKQFGKDRPMGADDLLPALIDLLRSAKATEFDVFLAEKSLERLQNSGEASYYFTTLLSAVTVLDDPREGGPLPSTDKILMDKYNNNPIDKVINQFQHSTDPFTLSKQNGLGKVAQAYRQIKTAPITVIAEAIIEDPKLAESFFKRRVGTRLPGRRNFRKELLEMPSLVEMLINTQDPEIIAKIKESKLLDSSHMKPEWREHLKTALDNAEKFIDIRERLSGMGEKDEDILENQELLSRAAENLEKMKPLDNDPKQACIDILEKITNKELKEMLKENVANHPSENLPNVNQVQAFVDDINKNLKAESGVGLNYKRYLQLLADTKHDGKIVNLFKLQKTDFPSDNKGFQPPLPTALGAKTVKPNIDDGHHLKK